MFVDGDAPGVTQGIGAGAGEPMPQTKSMDDTTRLGCHIADDARLVQNQTLVVRLLGFAALGGEVRVNGRPHLPIRHSAHGEGEPWSVHWIELGVPFLHALSHPLLSRRFISRLSSLHA